MIHNLKLIKNKAGQSTLLFTVITVLGKAFCKVTLDEKDKDGRSKLWVVEYEVLGVEYDEIQHGADKVMGEGLKRIGNTVREICDNNGWNLWSY